MNKIEIQKQSNLESINKTIIQNLKLLQKEFPKKVNIISAYYNYFLDQNFSNETQVLNNFIAFLDMHFIDQISNQIHYSFDTGKNFLSLYGRDRNQKNLWRKVKLEKNIIWRQTWKNKSNLIDSSLFEYLQQKPSYNIYFVDETNFQDVKTKTWLNVFYFSKSLSLEHFEFLHTFRPKWNFILFGKVDMWDGLFVEFEKSNQNKSWAQKYPELLQNIRQNKYKPLNLPDIQNVIKKRLLATGNIFWHINQDKQSIWNFQDFTKDQVNDILFKSDSKKSVRLFDLKTMASKEQTEQFSQKHIRHYKKHFQDNIAWVPEVFLTNSWVSWTYAITSYLEDTVSDFDLWHEYDFYYENVQKFLAKKTHIHKDTQVFLVSPSILSPTKWISNEIFIEKLKKELELFLQNALASPDKFFYLVVDVTTKLDLQISDLIDGNIPPNLIVTKSYSLSKHQRGDTRYFMWWVALYGNHPQVKEWIEKTIIDNGFHLTHEQILHYPRLRKSEIQKNVEHITKNREAFKKWFFSQINNGWLSQFLPEIIESEYFSFLLPPLPEILYFVKHGKWSDVKISNLNTWDLDLIQYGNIVPNHPIWYVWDLIPSFLYFDFIKYTSTDLRDSFWLKKNNISSHYKDVWLLFFSNKETPEYKPLELLRVSFWIQKNIQNSYKLWVNLAKSYELWIQKIMKHSYVTKKTS